MRYLGGIRGNGDLKYGTDNVGRVAYDFDGYMSRPGQVTGSGEIRASKQLLHDIFGRRGLTLVTDHGRTLNVTFTEKTLRADSVSVHVDVAGDLPSAADWRQPDIATSDEATAG